MGEPRPAPTGGALTGGALTRSRILDAAASLMSGVGITRTTTKEIARAAGCSEATLYKHFRDKEEIFVSVLRERAPWFGDVLSDLTAGDGEAAPADVLTELADTAVRFYRQAFPMAASVFASQQLLTAHRGKLDLATMGPHAAPRQLAAYLRAERDRGRIRVDVDVDAAAALFIGACFHRAFLELFLGDAAPPDALRPDGAAFGAGIVTTLLTGISPAGTSD